MAIQAGVKERSGRENHASIYGPLFRLINMRITTGLYVASKLVARFSGAVYALLAIACLMLFSVVNTYQKYQTQTLPHLPIEKLFQSVSFGLVVLLLGCFACFGYFAVKHNVRGGSDPARHTPMVTGAYDPLLTLRAIACFMVLFGHGMSITLQQSKFATLASHRPIWLVTASAETGVWIFFTLSGYLMGKGFFTERYKLNVPNVRDFYYNRFLRIIPVYWFVVIVICALHYITIFEPRNLAALASMLTLNFDGSLPFNPISALWSVGAEFQFYLAAPFLFIILGRAGEWSAPGVVLFLLLAVANCGLRGFEISAGGFAAWHDFAYMPLISNLDIFLAGMVTSKLVVSSKRAGMEIKTGIFCGFLVIGALYIVMSYANGQSLVLGHPAALFIFATFGPSFTAVSTAVAIYCFELAPSRAGRSFRYRLGRGTHVFGTLTYATYCLHEPVFLALKASTPPTGNVLHAVLVLSATILKIVLLATLVYWVVEHPFNRHKKRHVAPAGVAAVQ